MKVSERTAQYEKLLSVSKSVIRECDTEAKRLRDIAINFRNIAEQYDAMAEETDTQTRTARFTGSRRSATKRMASPCTA